VAARCADLCDHPSDAVWLVKVMARTAGLGNGDVQALHVSHLPGHPWKGR
jgi:hypothetical protein